jgi:hypothetical protein
LCKQVRTLPLTLPGVRNCQNDHVANKVELSFHEAESHRVPPRAAAIQSLPSPCNNEQAHYSVKNSSVSISVQGHVTMAGVFLLHIASALVVRGLDDGSKISIT